MTLKVTVEPVRSRIATGENLLVRATFHNDGASPAPVRSAHQRSPFIYRLMPVGGGQPYVLSEERKAIGTTRSTAPYKPGPPVSLAPGKTLSREDNLGGWTELPLAPGHYMLSATVEGAPALRPPSVRIEVVAPRVRAWQSVVCPTTSHLTTVIGAQLDDDATMLLHRDTTPVFATYSPFWRSKALAKDVVVADVAIAVKSGEGYSGRWIVWRADGSDALTAAFAGNALTILGPNEVATGLLEPVLLGPALQRADGSGAVLVSGLAAGRREVRGYRLGPKAITREWSVAIPQLVADRLPCAVQYPTDESVRLVWLWEGDGDPAELQLATFSIDDAGTKCTFDVRAPMGLHGRLLTSDPSTPLARPESWIDVLLSLDLRLVYVRIPLASDTPPDVRGSMSLPPSAADAFAICASTDATAVLARTRGVLRANHVWGDDWMTIADGVDEASHLKLFHIGGRFHWAEWVEEVRGIRLERLDPPVGT